MGIITRMRKEKAVHWPFVGLNEFGEEQYGAPEEIDCRWEDVGELRVDPDGTEFTATSTVYVDRVMKVQSYLWRGELANAPADPVEDFDARKIRIFEQMPKLNYKETLLTATLGKSTGNS